MRKSALAAASIIVLLALLLCGCGGGGHKAKTSATLSSTTSSSTSTSAQTVRTFGSPARILAPSSSPARTLRQRHPCTPSDYYMQCRSNASGQVAGSARRFGGASATFGLDFAWGGPSGVFARAHGAHFAISYLSFDLSKDWSRSLLASWRAAGLQVGFVWETGATRPLSGCAGGTSDAVNANARLAALGYPGAPVFFADDFDTTGFSSTGVVGSYYRCAAHTIGNGRSGAYGGKRTIEIAAANGVRFLWQTVAWSRGVWDPRACVRQTSIDHSWFGFGVDYNLALCSNWGQYGATPPPPPGPTPATLRAWRADRNRTFASYRRGGCRYPQQSDQCRKLGARVVGDQEKLWTRYARWPLFGVHARTGSLVAWIVRPEVSVWSQRRDASRRVAQRRGCFLKSDRRCREVNQRFGWFERQATGTVGKFS